MQCLAKSRRAELNSIWLRHGALPFRTWKRSAACKKGNVKNGTAPSWGSFPSPGPHLTSSLTVFLKAGQGTLLHTLGGDSVIPTAESHGPFSPQHRVFSSGCGWGCSALFCGTFGDREPLNLIITHHHWHPLVSKDDGIML